MAEARLGIARLGASRLGDYRPYVFLTVDGVARRLRIADLSIRDTEGGNPNTATVRVSGFTPNEGESIRIGLGAIDANHQIFAGHILKRTRVYEADKVENIAYDLSCISHEWRLNRHKVNAKFSSQSATAIATALIAAYAPDFTVEHVVAGLPSLEEFTLTNEDLTDAFDRLTARIGGAWYVDESKDLHLFLSETLTATTIDDTHRGASRVRWDRDLSGVRTQVTVEGAGVTATAPAVPGDTALAVDDLLWYPPGGGTVVAGPQRLTYTGVVVGGIGALVGTTVTPTNGPTPAARAVSGLTAGDYRWKFTFITASGETLPSPASAVLTLGVAVSAPASAPPVAKAFGGSLTASGVYKWKYAYLTAAGETLASSESASLTMDGDIAAPSAIGTPATDLLSGGGYDTGSSHFSYKFTFSNGSVETTPSPKSTEFGRSPGESEKLTRSGNTAPPAGFGRKFYRANASAGPWKAMPGSSDGFTSDDVTYYYDRIPDASLGATIPSSSTAIYRSATVNVVASADALVTNIRIYRTAAGGSTFKKVADIANTTGAYIDTLADASLGSTELGAATALYLAADLTGIAVGPSGTTQRKVYRTAVNGSTYGLLTTIANNTATTYTDTTADGSLGAAPPVTDTSGLTTANGEVAAGSTSIAVTSTGAFRSAGGWAFIGSMPIRYTGISGATITGVPALGNDGSLGTTVKYGVEIVAAPLLVGIPASGPGSIQYPISAGDDVNILVTKDDLAAQAAMSDLLTAAGEDPADGVIEEYIQDRRLSSTEAAARAQAELDLVKDPLITVQYETFDRFTRSGREVTFNSTLLGLVGTFKIQSVTISGFDGTQQHWPRRQVLASSRRFTFEALLRQVRI